MNELHELAAQRGWRVRPGLRPGMLVAERAGQCLYANGEKELFRLLRFRGGREWTAFPDRGEG